MFWTYTNTRCGPFELRQVYQPQTKSSKHYPFASCSILKFLPNENSFSLKKNRVISLSRITPYLDPPYLSELCFVDFSMVHQKGFGVWYMISILDIVVSIPYAVISILGDEIRAPKRGKVSQKTRLFWCVLLFCHIIWNSYHNIWNIYQQYHCGVPQTDSALWAPFGTCINIWNCYLVHLMKRSIFGRKLNWSDINKSVKCEQLLCLFYIINSSLTIKLHTLIK